MRPPPLPKLQSPPSKQRVRNPALGVPADAVLAGVDEAGVGSWAGPVVAAAVILPRGHQFSIRIDDSKRLSAIQRQRAYPEILAHACVGVGIVSAASIDATNIRRATLLAMQQAVAHLQTTPTFVLIDGTAAPELPMPTRCLINGDQLHRSISCASIIAKVTRDRLMEAYHRMFPAYQLHRHKGYGTDEHQRALAEYGPSFIHRLSFAPVAASLSRPAC